MLGCIQPHHGFTDLGVDVFHRFQDALAQEAGCVLVAEFDGFTRAGRRARGHGRTANHAGLQKYVGFNGGIAARIQNFAGDDINDGGHGIKRSKSLVVRICLLLAGA